MSVPPLGGHQVVKRSENVWNNLEIRWTWFLGADIEHGRRFFSSEWFFKKKWNTYLNATIEDQGSREPLIAKRGHTLFVFKRILFFRPRLGILIFCLLKAENILKIFLNFRSKKYALAYDISLGYATVALHSGIVLWYRVRSIVLNFLYMFINTLMTQKYIILSEFSIPASELFL